MLATLSRLAVLFALVAACDSGANRRPPPAAPGGTGAAPAPTGAATNPAPTGGPFLAELKARVEREWPGIESSGQAFLAKYAEVEKLHAAGDRAGMATAIREATEQFEKANEAWAEIYNSIDDKMDSKAIDAATGEQCKKYLRERNATVTQWVQKAAAMSKFSTR